MSESRVVYVPCAGAGLASSSFVTKVCLRRERESNLFWCKDYVDLASRPAPVADAAPIGGGCPWGLLHEVLDRESFTPNALSPHSSCGSPNRPAGVAKLYAPVCRHRDIAAGADHRTPEKIAAVSNLDDTSRKGQSVHLAGVQMLEVKRNHIITGTNYGDGGALHRQLSAS